VCNPKILDYIEGDSSVFEKEPLEKLAETRQLVTYKHRDFWSAMDTVRDKNILESLIEKGTAPWMLWENHPSRFVVPENGSAKVGVEK
jgi:glucose-1-phosphate cytidylyltransferase